MSLNRAIDKLIDTSRLIELRMAFKAAEGKRVREAFEVLTSGAPQPGSKGFKQKTVYLEVLQRVLTLLGPAEVALCAAALGPSSIAALKDRDRVALPHEMKKRKARFRGQHIQRLASQQSTGIFTPTEAPAPEISKSPREELNQNTVVIAQTTDSSIPRSSLRGPTVGLPTSQTDQNVTWSLTGDVYEVTADDVRNIAMSDQILGKIFLTDTYLAGTSSFVLIPISDQLTNELIMHRPRVM